MNKSIQKKGGEVFFSLKEGSNYKVMMTYDREEVVEFEQFKKIMLVLNDSDFKFITINQSVVNKNTIIDISPTEKKTEKQKEDMKRNPPEELIVDDGKGNPIKVSQIIESGE
jgi:hypothetical protein